MEKDFQRCLVSSHRAWDISAASVRLSAAPVYKSGSAKMSRRLAYAFRKNVWPAWIHARRTGSARLLMALKSLDQEKSVYTSAVRALSGGGSMSVLWLRDLADAHEVGLWGSLVAVAAVLASSLLQIPLWPGTNRKVVGPGWTLRGDLRR